MKCPHGNPIASACIECSNPHEPLRLFGLQSADEFVKAHRKCANNDGGVSVYGEPPKWARCICGARWEPAPRELCHE